MSSAASSSAPRETRHGMKLRHKAELKSLLSASAKGIGAKKKQKEDAAALEAKHEAELKEFDRKEKAESEDAEDKPAATGENGEAAATSGEADEDASSTSASSKGPSRAQKKKAAKVEKEKNRAAELRELTKDMVDARGNENSAIEKLLKPADLRVKEMVSDGHCLYRAVYDQVREHDLFSTLSFNDNIAPYLSMRQVAADYIRNHKADFEAFMLIEDDNGEIQPLTEATWKSYFADLVNAEKAIWGSHNEIVALSKALKRCIVIWSADGKMEVGEEFRASTPTASSSSSSSSSTNPIDASPSPQPDNLDFNISFHKHYYGLGNHYNSVVRAEEADEFDQPAAASAPAAAAAPAN